MTAARAGFEPRTRPFSRNLAKCLTTVRVEQPISAAISTIVLPQRKPSRISSISASARCRPRTRLMPTPMMEARKRGANVEHGRKGSSSPARTRPLLEIQVSARKERPATGRSPHRIVAGRNRAGTFRLPRPRDQINSGQQPPPRPLPGRAWRMDSEAVSSR
jgi:hypothetical protein